MIPAGLPTNQRETWEKLDEALKLMLGEDYKRIIAKKGQGAIDAEVSLLMFHIMSYGMAFVAWANKNQTPEEKIQTERLREKVFGPRPPS